MKFTKKNQKFKHLILFDDTCPLCHKAVTHIISIDKKKLFLFSPLIGKTAASVLKGKQATFIKKNTLVLIENYQTSSRISIRSKAIFRIYSYIGRGYRLLGLLAFCPILFDPIYRLIAYHRHKLKKQKGSNIDKDRYVP